MSRTNLPVFRNTANDVLAQDTPISHSEPAKEAFSSSSSTLESEPATLSSLLSQSSVSLPMQSSSTTLKEQDYSSFNSDIPNLDITSIPSKPKGGMENPRSNNGSEQPSSQKRAAEDPNLALPKSLPTNSQRLESARLTSVVTPRPYGTSSPRLSSIFRKSTEVKMLDQDSSGVRAGTHVPYLNQPPIPSEEKQQEEKERRNPQGDYNHYVAGNQEKQTELECLTESRSRRNKVDLMRTSEGDDSTVERKHVEEREKYWLPKEQDAVSAHQDGKDMPQLQVAWAKSESMPKRKEDEKPKDLVKNRGMTEWFLGEEMKRRMNTEVRRQEAVAELEAERRNIVNAMKYREPERVVHSDQDRVSWNENPTNDSSTGGLQDRWMPQQAGSTRKEESGEWVNNVGEPKTSWRSTVTSGSSSFRPDYGHSQHTSSGTSNQSEDQLPGQRPPLQQQQIRSVSGRKICTFCDKPLGKGAAMIIESLALCYHLTCFKCNNCQSELGGSEAGTEVRIRNGKLYCTSCYMILKTGHATII